MRLSERNEGTSPSAMRLRQAFDDGGFADAGFADQHWIVLGAAAKDLDHAIDFVIAANERIEHAIDGGLCQIAAEFGEQRTFLGAAGGRFFGCGTRDFFANGGEPQAALMQDFGGEAFLFAQQAEQKMFGANVLVAEPFGFFGAIGEHAFAFVAEGKIDRSRNFLPHGGMRLNLLANGFDGGVRPQESIGESFILAQQA